MDADIMWDHASAPNPRGVGRIAVNRALKKGPGESVLGRVTFGHVPHAALICLPRPQFLGMLPRGPLPLGTDDRRGNGRRQGSWNLVFAGQKVWPEIVALGANARPCCCVYEL